MADVLVGIDIGGTKTHLRFYEPNGVPQDLLLPTPEWRLRDWDQDARYLVTAAEKFVASYGNHKYQIAAIGVGANGCDNSDECLQFQTSFSKLTYTPVLVVNDAELLPAAVGLQNEIGLVAGTGSIGVYRNSNDEMLVAGGWGWVIGDEGSAAGLIREAAKAVSLHLDYGGSYSEPLVQLFLQRLGIESAARIGSTITSLGSAATLGQYASLVFEAADAGSQLAYRVIEDGAAQLADLVARLKHNGAQATQVVAGGSVIASQPLLANAFFRHIHDRFGETMTATLYSGPPVEGAVRLASKLTNSTQHALELQDHPTPTFE